MNIPSPSVSAHFLSKAVRLTALISVRRAFDHPQVISTDRHLLQGWVDLEDVTWDAKKSTLAGVAKVIGGETFRIAIAGNGTELKKAEVTSGKVKLEKHPSAVDVWVLSIDADATGDVEWAVR